MTFYQKNTDRITCLLCSYYCQLKEQQIGVCNVNKNDNGELKNLVYGYVEALNIDPIEKKPLYHFYPGSKSLSLGTVGCNFRCSFCQNWQLSQESIINKNKYYSPLDIVLLAKKYKCESISYTYNEPTIFYPYVKDIAKQAKVYNIKSVLVSNGFLSKEVINDMQNHIDAINIDLKCFDKKYYKKLGGNLDTILENLKLIHKSKIHLEITTLIVPSKNDSKQELEKIAHFITTKLDSMVPWHISAFHKAYKEQSLENTSKEKLLEAKRIGEIAGLKHVYIGNIGYENITTCVNCNNELITREFFALKKISLNKNVCSKCKQILRGRYYE